VRTEHDREPDAGLVVRVLRLEHGQGEVITQRDRRHSSSAAIGSGTCSITGEASTKSHAPSANGSVWAGATTSTGSARPHGRG